MALRSSQARVERAALEIQESHYEAQEMKRKKRNVDTVESDFYHSFKLGTNYGNREGDVVQTTTIRYSWLLTICNVLLMGLFLNLNFRYHSKFLLMIFRCT